MSYTYDLGGNWRHEILLEKVLHEHLRQPQCVAGRDDNSIEYYDPEDPAAPVPFDTESIIKLLRGLGPDTSRALPARLSTRAMLRRCQHN